MKPFTTVASVVFGLVALAQLLRITLGLEVSMEIATSQLAAIPSMIGTTRAISSDASTTRAPGRVD